ncbi:MAG: GTP diphosphokinase, partial [Methyloprofundus sp.]
LHHFKLSNVDKLYIALGCNIISSRQLNYALIEVGGKKRQVKTRKTTQTKAQILEITVDGKDNILTHFAQCCHPHADDELTGFISHSNGIAIHRKDCVNISSLSDEKKRQLIEVRLKEREA